MPAPRRDTPHVRIVHSSLPLWLVGLAVIPVALLLLASVAFAAGLGIVGVFVLPLLFGRRRRPVARRSASDQPYIELDRADYRVVDDSNPRR